MSNKRAAVLMLVLSLVGIPIAMLNELNNLAALSAISTSGLEALAPFFLRLHNHGLNIAAVLWGLWLLPMGYLVFKSGFLPKFLAILLWLSAIGYLVSSFMYFLLPAVDLAYIGILLLGELGLPLWLAIMGINERKV